MSMLVKLNCFHLTNLMTLVLLIWKCIGLFLWKNHPLRWWSSLAVLNCIGAFTLSLLLKLPLRTLEPWFVLWSLYHLWLLCISINLPYNHAWNTVFISAPRCSLELLDKQQKQICRTVGPSLADCLEPLAHRWNVTTLSLYYRYYFGRCSSELAQPVLLSYFLSSSTCYSDRLDDSFVTIPRCYKDFYISGFFPCTARLWNSQPIEWFALTYDLNGN